MENCISNEPRHQRLSTKLGRSSEGPMLHAPTSAISRQEDGAYSTRTVILANCCSTCRFLPTNLIYLILFPLRFLMRGHLRALEFRLNARSNGTGGGIGKSNSVVRCSNNGNGGKISRNTPAPSLFQLNEFFHYSCNRENSIPPPFRRRSSLRDKNLRCNSLFVVLGCSKKVIKRRFPKVIGKILSLLL